MAVANPPWNPIPNSADKGILLVPPFISGNGANGSMFTLYFEPPGLNHGDIILIGDHGAYVQDLRISHDFFEDIGTARCQLIENNPSIKVNPRTDRVYRTGSAMAQR